MLIAAPESVIVGAVSVNDEPVMLVEAPPALVWTCVVAEAEIEAEEMVVAWSVSVSVVEPTVACVCDAARATVLFGNAIVMPSAIDIVIVALSAVSVMPVLSIVILAVTLSLTFVSISSVPVVPWRSSRTIVEVFVCSVLRVGDAFAGMVPEVQ
jgi:hypothetical protein